ncbi:MAG TPA: hypothetical protein DDW76_03315 [Cyanobacteria bacterium UBA11369]|nr:hypothetical protein [Cyanobacteria bacterium UBA11371]HBE17180.1 hypothetical protein [Cyanobacteria bacterium UBA11367]HBE37023.1 hypothetical protein [Cyanobacteria bacterium UBA11368]HBE47847.1 hypothetical protein [Cyanobacteria bacterium UBA11369]
MAESNSTGLPSFNSTQELVEFFDTHDMGEFWTEMPEAYFDVDIKGKQYLISVDESLMSKLLEIAKAQEVSIESLVDSWLKEKVLEVS